MDVAFNLMDLTMILVTTLGIIVSILLAGIGWILYGIWINLKTFQTAQDQRFKNAEQNISEIRNNFSDFKLFVPQNYVMRDDYIRTIATFDHKLDSLTKTISGMAQDLNRICADRRAIEGE